MVRSSLAILLASAVTASAPTLAAQYTYTARFEGPVKGGAVQASSIQWKCQGSACTTAGPWPTPGVNACRALAQAQGRRITSYGHPGRSLSARELDQCNQGVAKLPGVAPAGRSVREAAGLRNTGKGRAGIVGPDMRAPSGIVGPDMKPPSAGIVGPDMKSPSAGIVGPDMRRSSTGIVGPDMKPPSSGIVGPDMKPPSAGIVGPDMKPRSTGIVGPDMRTKRDTAGPGVSGGFGKLQTARAVTPGGPAAGVVAENRSRFEALQQKRIAMTGGDRSLRNASSAIAAKQSNMRRYGGTDCDDNRRDVHPGANETCDGVDNDCDGLVDEGQTLPVYLDADGDAHGDPDTRLDACPADLQRAQAEGRWLVTIGNDCDDDDPTIWFGCR